MLETCHIIGYLCLLLTTLMVLCLQRTFNEIKIIVKSTNPKKGSKFASRCSHNKQIKPLQSPKPKLLVTKLPENT